MLALHRHQLAWLTASAWYEVLAREWPQATRSGLAHWQAHHLPMMVTRQPARDPAATAVNPATVQLGLPLPARWGRQSITLAVPHEGIHRLGECPQLGEALAVLPRHQQLAFALLDKRLREMGTQARAYGSVGWQSLTGLDYLHAQSDLDLWLPVQEAAQADRVAAMLQAGDWPLRVDGELCFPGGAAVAWREWLAARAGRQAQVLVKRLHGVCLESPSSVEAEPWLQAA